MISERQLKEYCSGDVTEIENYADAVNDTTRKWECHHRLELTEDGDFAYSKKDLIKLGLYNKRPSEELIFLTPSEHSRIHGKGKSYTTIEKLSKAGKANKGSKNPFYGKVHSDATKEQISKSKKGKPYMHHDITVSQKDDPKEYGRQYRAKMKALAANK